MSDGDRSTPAAPAVPALFPAFLRLSGKRVLIVGAGPVAASKLKALLEAEALVTVVAPDIHPDFDAPGITQVRRPFEVSDLDGVWYVVAAAPPAVNRAVSAAAAERHLFVNAVDDPPNASVYLGAVVRREGGVTLALRIFRARSRFRSIEARAPGSGCRAAQAATSTFRRNAMSRTHMLALCVLVGGASPASADVIGEANLDLLLRGCAPATSTIIATTGGHSDCDNGRRGHRSDGLCR